MVRFSDWIENDYVPASLILGVALFLCSVVVANTYYSVRSLSNTLTVTGSAAATSTADSAKWHIAVSRTAFEGGLPAAHDRIVADVRAVRQFLLSNGISESDIDTSPEFVNQQYNSDKNAPTSYDVRQEITLSSKDPALVAKLSKDISVLTSRGIILSASMPEYYISDLPQIRVQLIGHAVEDARARATEIARSTGQKVGKLQSASSGVVQVMAPNSTDVADYGSYDTSTIDKQVTVTARAVFLLK